MASFDVEKEALCTLARMNAYNNEPNQQALINFANRAVEATEEECIEMLGTMKNEAKRECYDAFAAGVVHGFAKSCVAIHERRRRRREGK